MTCWGDLGNDSLMILRPTRNYKARKVTNPKNLSNNLWKFSQYTWKMCIFEINSFVITGIDVGHHTMSFSWRISKDVYNADGVSLVPFPSCFGSWGSVSQRTMRFRCVREGSNRGPIQHPINTLSSKLLVSSLPLSLIIKRSWWARCATAMAPAAMFIQL